MRNKDYPFFTGLFVLAAAWNLVGAGFGYFNAANTPITNLMSITRF